MKFKFNAGLQQRTPPICSTADNVGRSRATLLLVGRVGEGGAAVPTTVQVAVRLRDSAVRKPRQFPE